MNYCLLYSLLLNEMNLFLYRLLQNFYSAIFIAFFPFAKTTLQRLKTSSTEISSINSLLRMKYFSGPNGAQLNGLVGPHTDIWGVAVVAATCIIPVALHIQTSDLGINPAHSG